MADIVEKLRDFALSRQIYGEEVNTLEEAADEIEQNRIDLEEYRRDVERLRAAIEEIYKSSHQVHIIEIARAALGGDND